VPSSTRCAAFKPQTHDPLSTCLSPYLSTPRPIQIDHTVHTFSASVDVSYNVRRLPPVESLSCTRPLTRCAPFACGSSSRTRRARARTRTLFAKADARS
jgi:hypothetical protein